jgi:RNA 2',3'-cyclic 3'-phosphodiesterase
VTGASARLFVALELPDDVKAALTSWSTAQLGSVDGLRRVSAEALHLTLCFLGWRPADEMDAIASECDAIADEPAVSVSLGEVLWLPRRRPRVVAVSLDPVSESDGRDLQALQSRLATALSARGFYEPEQRPFLPHVTFARVRRGARARAAEVPAPEPVRFSLSTVTLFRSHMGRGGSRYEPLIRVPLRRR